MNEGLAKQRLRRILERDDCNALIFSFAGSMFSKSGIPDWFVAHRIWTGWIEHKYATGDLSAGQRITIEKLRHRDVKTAVVRTVDKFNANDWKHPRSAVNMYLEDLEGKTISTLALHSKMTGVEFLEWIRSNT